MNAILALTRRFGISQSTLARAVMLYKDDALLHSTDSENDLTPYQWAEAFATLPYDEQLGYVKLAEQ